MVAFAVAGLTSLAVHISSPRGWMTRFPKKKVARAVLCI